MNRDSSSETPSLHLPFTLLALAVAVLLASQIGASNQSADIMRWQTDTLEKQITTMQGLDKQYGEAFVKRDVLVKQSAELQTQLQSLLNDLLDLAKTDTDANQIIEKYKVQRAAPPAEDKKTEEKKAP